MIHHQITNLIKPGDLIFDIGANQGDKSQWFADLGARVVCVEPQPAMVRLLKERFQGNPSIKIEQKALGVRPGRSMMSISTSSPALSTLTDHWKEGRFSNVVWDQNIEVEVTTLNNLIEIYGIPRYCKIDVEGFELAVLQGLSLKIGAISFEFTSEFISHAMEAIELLIHLGYKNFNVSLGEQPNFQFSSWEPYYTIVHALISATTTNQKNLLWGDIYCQ